MLGTFLILITTLVVTGFCIQMIMTREEPVQGFIPLNRSGFWDMVGFAVYTYEGIGVVMPIMSTCNCPEKFPFLLASAVTLLTIIYIAFGELCYYTFGNMLTKPIILEMMPADNPIIMIVKMLFCINLACLYPLCIYPVNLILESYLFKSFT
jgi:proton-coupled amino acid transporter